MLVTQCTLTHVCQLNSSFGACIHEPITAYGMELGSSNDLRELFHVGRFDIDDVEALVLNVKIP